MKKITLFLLMLLGIVVSGFAQGVTSSSLNGKVTDDTGGPLPGANVIAVQSSSGTTYGATTDFDGYYRISNMRSGGPYKLTISYVGFEDFLTENIYLQLGESKNVSVQMKTEANALDEVVITGNANSVFDSGKTGTETTITQRDINTLPAVTRSIADFVRLTPQAQINEGDDGFSISLAGQNNRFNAIYIDGAVNNDVFGLAGSGTNGGQTGVNPFSVDAIETFQVNIAPFDVRQSGFSGGSINAITRSGTNNFKGSAYGFYRNENLAGKTPPDLVEESDSREKLDEFSALTYGVRVGGPIIKDKLFFFLNYERQEDETPQPFKINNYIGNADEAKLTELRNYVSDTYNYDIGVFDNNSRSLKSDKLTAKIDWNIDQNNKLSFKHSYVKGENFEARSSDNNDIAFTTGSEEFITTTNSTAIELSSSIGNSMANNLIVGYTTVRDDRDPSGSPFPNVRIFDGNGGADINFGADTFSTANLLNSDVLTVNNNFEIFSGKHAVTIGVNYEYVKIKNLFFADNFGAYQFRSVDEFIGGLDASRYQHQYSLIGSTAVGDDSDGAAEFSTNQIGFYVQDEVNLAPNFKFTFGLRADVPIWEEGLSNDVFNEDVIPVLESFGKDLQGSKVGQTIKPTAHLSPRIGFNWDVKDDKSTQVRGGLGIFTSRVPYVWPGATFNNNGITSGFTQINRDRDDDGNDIIGTGVPFNTDVNDLVRTADLNSGVQNGNVYLIAEDFMLPQVMKYNIAIDQKLPWWNLIASADFLFTDVITDLYYENLNIKPSIERLQGADNRPIYDNFRNEIDRSYQGIYLISNTGGGSAYNASFTLRKPFQNGFQGQISYSYGESEKIFDGTSSQISSQWRNQQSVNGKNSNLPVTRSDFSLGSRISGNVSYEIEYAKNFKTTLGLFYEGQQGRPYSFIYNEGNRGNADLLRDDSRDNALIYIPRNIGEINLVDIEGGKTAAQQWDVLNSFIENDDYLSENRGSYAERNASYAKWTHTLDLKFLQDFYITTANQKKHTLQFSLDIFNFTNLLNKNWGKRYFISNFGAFSPITTVRNGTNPEFQVNERAIEQGINEIDNAGIQSSRWQMQIGLRYIFE